MTVTLWDDEDEVLKSQLLSILEYSTEDIEPKGPVKLLKLMKKEVQDRKENVDTVEKLNDHEIIELFDWCQKALSKAG